MEIYFNIVKYNFARKCSKIPPDLLAFAMGKAQSQSISLSSDDGGMSRRLLLGLVNFHLQKVDHAGHGWSLGGRMVPASLHQDRNVGFNRCILTYELVVVVVVIVLGRVCRAVMDRRSMVHRERKLSLIRSHRRQILTRQLRCALVRCESVRAPEQLRQL